MIPATDVRPSVLISGFAVSCDVRVVKMTDEEQLLALKSLCQELQQLYLLLRSVRSDLTKITDNLETSKMTGVLGNFETIYMKDTFMEINNTHENSIVDSNASGSVNKKSKCAGKRRSFSFKEKIFILKELETESIASVCDKFGLNDRTLRNWTAKRKEIEKAFEKESFQNRKKNRTIANEDVEDALYSWFIQARKNGVPISGTILKNKALMLNNELGGSESFKASEGWLSGWKTRKEVRLPRINDKKLSADLEAWINYKIDFANVLKDKRLMRAQVFNLDSIGLSYKLLPAKLITKNDKTQASVLRNEKDRVTIGVCSNADGSLKLRLVVVGKSAHPRTIKNLNKDRLPACYKNEKNSLMDVVVFENWFKDEFVPRVKEFLIKKNLPIKALLVISNSNYRYNFIKIGDIETMFLPENVKSVIHPEEETILEILRKDYKYALVKSIFDAQVNGMCLHDHLKKVTIKEIIFWISMAWEEISSTDIYKLWTKIWPIETEIWTFDTKILPIETEEIVFRKKNITNKEIFNILQSIKGYESTNENVVNDWITAAEDWEKEKEFSDLQIIAQVGRPNDKRI